MIRCIITLILIGAGLSVLAQTITPKVGVTLANVKDDDFTAGASQPKQKIGLSLGLSFSGKSKKRLNISPELLFIQKGYRVDHGGNSINYTENEKLSLRISYLELPILAKFHLDHTRKIYIGFGFYGAIAIGGHYKYSYQKNDNGIITEDSKSGKLDFNKAILAYNGENYGVHKRDDFGILFGAGVNIKRIILELRYDNGFTQLSPKDSSNPKNRCVQFSLGIPLNLKPVKRE